MSETIAAHGYKTYVIILGILLAVTLVMIFIGESSMAPAPQALLLLLGSAIKATLIIFYYMHMRFENFGLILTVLVGIFITSFLMFVIPAYDGAYILENSIFQ